jgi:diguanylate cyclase (GGDEF)-like protein
MTTLAVLLPDADTSHLSLAVAVIAFAAAMALVTLLRIPAVGRGAYLIADLSRLPGLVLMVYLTGGATSPLLPLALVGVAIAAYLSAPRVALLRLLGSVLVCASPFAYSADAASATFIVRFITLVTTACALAGILLYSRRELARAEQAATELASSDPLTGLANRRAFERQVAQALDGARTEAGAIFSVTIIDLDNFKRVNDRHGHAAGDLVLKAIASALVTVTREDDRVARIGGDEFALVAVGADTGASRAIGERCVRAAEQAVAAAGYSDCEVSATVGYAIYPHHGATLDALVEAADSALMNAKGQGKHAVASAPDPAPGSLLASA